MAEVRVWDPWLRLTHLGLIVGVLGAYGTAEWGWFSMDAHFWFGYAVLVLVIFRVLWGFCGTTHARFASFLRGPSAVFRELRGTADTSATLGHSALGGWATLVLLGALLFQSLTGLYTNDDILWFGPLSESLSYDQARTVSTLHVRFQNLLLALIGLHLLAVLLYLLVKKRNLITPMVTGRKALAATDYLPVPVWRAPVLLASSAASVWALIRYWPT
ncbi:MAG: cytochrome b/b6 domain-containing protein [Xanthomonadales bacterium]|jgi:cytochrome b|nr:cytochrome b/b6 domain-containing protein [Xanthomonadales bacterium]